VHPYALRHTHAAELAAEGLSAEVIQRQLGLQTLAITERYLRSIAPRERIKASQARQWMMN
jgi:integrase